MELATRKGYLGERRMTGLENIEEVLVVGLGISGQAAASKLLREKMRVTVNDISTTQDIERAAAELRERGAEVALGHHDAALLQGVDLVVVSPGVPSRLPLLREAESRGVPIWSEVELAWRFARGPVVAVTGTNGKTTTVSMIAWICERAGMQVLAAGNIGHPFISAVDEAGVGDTLVVEVSSFQLFYIEEFKPHVAVLLNIAEDHFDWHADMREYREAKSRIWMNQDQGDLVVCNMDDPLCVEMASGAPSRVVYFSRRSLAKATVLLEGENIIYRHQAHEEVAPEAVVIMNAGDVRLPGLHNLENAMAAAATTIALGVEPQDAGAALAAFGALPHRLQLIGEVEGIRFYNDSKATNPHAAMNALEAFTGPLVVIMGGKNKGLSFEELARVLDRRGRKGGVRAVYLIGDAAGEIKDALQRESDRLEVKVFHGLEEVFKDLPEVAVAGDTVLFSPACASFDRYTDYKQRGKHFQAMVDAYREGRGKHG